MEAARQTYPEYKNTAIPGFPSLPKHWQVARLKHLCDYHSLYGANIPASEYRDTGVRFLRTTDITDEGLLTDEGVYLPTQAVAEYILGDGDILLSRSGTVGRSFLYRHKIHGPCAYAGYLVRFVPKSHPLANYIHLFTKTTAFTEFIRTSAISSTIDNVNAEKYANCRLPLPPPDEQADIVRYLDHADQLISRYISAKERLIPLMEEQRQAVIHQAVTRGLDTSTAFEPFSVPELGDVPDHWEIVQLGRLGDFSKGSGGTKDDEVTEGLPCVRYGDIYTSHKYFVRQTRSFIARHRAHDYAPMKYGDVLFTGSGETIEDIGKSVVNLIDGEAYCGGDVILFRPRDKTHPEFLGYLLDSARAIHQKSSMGRGITIMHVYSSQLKYLWLALPPFADQVQIAEYLGKITNEVDQAIHGTQRQINLMNEYRTRLIADVVTGQIDVRGAAVELPTQHL